MSSAVEYVIHAFVLLASGWIAFSFLENLEDVKADVREKHGETGNLLLAAAGGSVTPRTYLFLRISCSGFLFFLGYILSNLVIGAIFGVLGWFLPLFWLRRLRRQRVLRVEQQLVEGLEMLGNGLKSGLTLPQACELLIKEMQGPISEEFSVLISETRLGVEFTEALENMASRLDSNIVHILASGVSITKRCGGNLTEIFSNIAGTIREQATVEGKLQAVTAQGRFQGLILGLMPFALVVILYFIDPGHIETLFGYQIGIFAFSAVVVMVVLAQLWIRKLMDIDV